MSNSIIDVTQSGAVSYTLDSSIFDVGNGVSMSLAGSYNHLYLEGSGETINLTGTNNSVEGNANSGPQLIQYGNAYVEEDADGGFTYSTGVGVNMDSNTGIATFSLGNGNTVTMSNVSNPNIWAAGTPIGLSWAMQPGSYTYTAIGTTVDIGSNISWALWGAADHVVLEGSGNITTLNGDNNTVAFNANNGAQAIQYGSAYVTEDTNGNITYSAGELLSVNGGNALLSLGDGNLVTISNVNASGSTISASGALGPVNLTQAGTTSYVGNGVTLNAGSNVALNLMGSSDHVYLKSGGDSVNLVGGSNDFIELNASLGAQTVQYGSAGVTEYANGAFAFSSGALHGVEGGVATLFLGNGNYVSISNVQYSGGTIWASGYPMNQLVSAMASYGADASGGSSTPVVQSQPEPALFASTHH